jgi:hypothetical protein
MNICILHGEQKDHLQGTRNEAIGIYTGYSWHQQMQDASKLLREGDALGPVGTTGELVQTLTKSHSESPMSPRQVLWLHWMMVRLNPFIPSRENSFTTSVQTHILDGKETSLLKLLLLRGGCLTRHET